MSSEPLKILMLSYWFPPKIAPAPYELARHLVKLGHEVFVLAGVFDHAMTIEDLDGVHVRRLEQYFPSFLGHVAYGLKASNQLSKLHAREGFDVVHAHGADGWFISRLGLKSKLNIPVIVTMHGSSKQELSALRGEGQHSLFSLMEKVHWIVQFNLDKWSLENADKVIAVSGQTADEVTKDYGIYPRNIEIIFNGVDTKRFSPTKYSPALRRKFTSKRILLYVGRLRARKGVQYLIRALPLILNECSDVSLVIVGEGEAKPSLRELAERIGVEKNVVFAGGITNQDLPMYYASSDVFICPSSYDPFPLVCLEAMASGTPIILTDKVGVREIVNEDVARIVGPKNEIALASTILELLSDEEKRRLMGNRARALAQEYDWINIAKKTCEVYADA